jgi:hypothetical protein
MKYGNSLELFPKSGLCFHPNMLKTCAEPISILSAQCRTVPVIRGSNLHKSIFLYLLCPARRARTSRIHSPPANSDKNHSHKRISMPLLSFYFPSSTLWVGNWLQVLVLFFRNPLISSLCSRGLKKILCEWSTPLLRRFQSAHLFVGFVGLFWFLWVCLFDSIPVHLFG